MIDTHCHLTYPGLADRVEQVLADAAAQGVDRMISIGTSLADSQKASEVAHSYAPVYATAGVHPHHAAEVKDIDALLTGLASLLKEPQVVGLGEIGIDLHYDDPSLATQKQVFHAQLELLRDSKLPCVIHNRKATEHTLAVLRESGLPGERFLFHCFTGSVAEAEQILDFGAMVGFTGIVTFKSAREVAEASDRVPLDRLFIETDSPYLTPEPHRKVKTNEPKFAKHVAEFLAQRRGMNLGDFVGQVDANAERFFSLPTD